MIIKKPEIKPIWYPPKRWDDYVNTWDNFKLGVMICYGMTTYTSSDSYAVNRYIVPPDSTTFAPPDDIMKKAINWINDINNTNEIDYFIISTSHHIGFNCYESHIELPTQNVNDSYFGSIQLPMRANYFYSKQQYIDGMVNKCNSLGKPFFLYHNIGKRVNDRGSNNYGDEGIYKEIMFLRLKELIVKYKPFGLWLDAPSEIPWNNNTINGSLHRLYSRLKNIDNNIQITINFASNQTTVYDINSNTLFWPCDNFSLETQIRSWTDTDEYKPLKLFNNIKYYMNTEALTSNNSNNIFFGAPDKSAVWFSQSAIQNYYNYAKSNGMPYCINMSPSQSGILGSNQLNLLSNLVL